MALKLVTAPSEEPVSLAEAKMHLRVDGVSDDSLIESLIAAARELVENATGRVFVTQTWDLWLDCFPKISKRGRDSWWDGVREIPLTELYETVRFIEIPKSPLQSVEFFKTYDSSNSEAEFSTSKYLVDAQSTPGRVALNYGETWPGVTLRPVNGVQIRFVAGYGNATSVPRSIKQAILLTVSHLYENRGEEKSDLPMSAWALLKPYEVMQL